MTVAHSHKPKGTKHGSVESRRWRGNANAGGIGEAVRNQKMPVGASRDPSYARKTTKIMKKTMRMKKTLTMSQRLEVTDWKYLRISE